MQPIFLFKHRHSMKIVQSLIESLYWMNIFIVPVVFIGGTGFLLYHQYPATWGFIIFLLLGISSIILGIYWAEKTRKTTGCSVFVNRIFSSPDVNGKEENQSKKTTAK